MSDTTADAAALLASNEFDEEWYLSQYPDVRLLGMGAAEHFVWIGKRLGRSPAPPNQALARPLALAGDRLGRAAQTFCDWICGTGTVVSPTLRARLQQRVLESVAHNEHGPSAGALLDLAAYLEKRVAAPLQTDAPDALPFAQSHNILLVTFYAPSRAHAGGLRLLDVYKRIKETNPAVQLEVFCAGHAHVDGDLAILDEVFDKVTVCAPDEFSQIGTRRGLARTYDVIDLQFHQAGQLAEQLRPFAKRLLFTPMESLARANCDVLRAHLSRGEPPSADQVRRCLDEVLVEIAAAQSVDLTVCVSSEDADFLKAMTPSSKVTYFSTGLSAFEFERQLADDFRAHTFKRRPKQLVYAAYFGSQTNIDGLLWYLDAVHPAVARACPDYRLMVVGRGNLDALQLEQRDRVVHVGEVLHLAPVFEQARAGLVLAVNGSGFRGKINQYAVCGLPAISTTLGASSLAYEKGKSILLADEPAGFAEACVRVLNDEAYAVQLACAARQVALDHYTWDCQWPAILAIYGLLRQETP